MCWRIKIRGECRLWTTLPADTVLERQKQTHIVFPCQSQSLFCWGCMTLREAVVSSRQKCQRVLLCSPCPASTACRANCLLIPEQGVKGTHCFLPSRFHSKKWGARPWWCRCTTLIASPSTTSLERSKYPWTPLTSPSQLRSGGTWTAQIKKRWASRRQSVFSEIVAKRCSSRCFLFVFAFLFLG